MLFVKLSNSLSINNFLNYWPIPVIFVIISSISLGLSNLLGKITNQSNYLKNFLKIAASFPNTNSIPTGIIHVLAISKSSDLLKWGNDDNSSAMDARGISYIIVYTAFCNMARWSYGIKLFEEPKIGERAHLLGPNSEELTLQPTKLSKLYNKLKIFLTPPLLGIYASIILIIIPGLKNILFGDFFIFSAVKNGLTYLGDCSIPMILLNLGCQFYFVSQKSQEHRIQVPVSTILVLRYFIIPFITLFVLYLLQPYYELGNDPMFQLAMLLVASGPPALDLIQMTTFTNTYRDEVAILLLYSYIIAIPCLTALVSFYLFIIPNWYN
jgi:predicted permease